MNYTDTKPVEALGYGVDFKCGVRMILFPKSQVRATPALVISVLDDDGIWQDWPIAVRSKGFSEFWKKAIAKLVGLEPDFKELADKEEEENIEPAISYQESALRMLADQD